MQPARVPLHRLHLSAQGCPAQWIGKQTRINTNRGKHTVNLVLLRSNACKQWYRPLRSERSAAMTTDAVSLAAGWSTVLCFARSGYSARCPTALRPKWNWWEADRFHVSWGTTQDDAWWHSDSWRTQDWWGSSTQPPDVDGMILCDLPSPKCADGSRTCAAFVARSSLSSTGAMSATAATAQADQQSALG